MIRKIFAVRVLMVAVWLIMASTGIAFADYVTYISINNPSFEVHDPYTKAISIEYLTDNRFLTKPWVEVHAPYSVPPGSREWIDSIVGWNISGNCGTMNFEDGVYTHIPDRENVAFSNGGVISQILSSTLYPNTTYELTVCVGTITDAAYTIQLLAGGNVLASDNNSMNSDDSFLASTITYTSSATDPYLGQNLEIRLTSNGVQPHFDDISLKATQAPEPTTMLLLGLGLIGVAGIRRKFQI